MRKRALTIGLLIILVGVFVLSEGTQDLSLAAETFGFATRVETDRVLIAPTLLTVPPSNYTFLAVDLSGGVKIKGSLQVADAKEIAVYVMDEGNFSMWRAGQPSTVILAKPVAIALNFTFTPSTNGTYYVVFDNHDTSRRAIIFNLSVEDTVVSVNPLIGYAGYELIALGIVFTTIGVRGGRKKDKQKPLTENLLACKFCGAKLEGDQVFCRQCGRAQR